MRRRDFISLLGSAAAARPLSARAQQGDGRAAALLARILQLRAEGTAGTISQTLRALVDQIGWTTQLPWPTGSMDQRRFDALRLLRQAIPVAEIAFLNPSGVQQLKVSRGPTEPGPINPDFSQEPKFTEAVAHKVFYGPVYLRNDTVYLTLSVAGTRRDAGVSVAEISPSLEQFVRQQSIGEHGIAYILDAQGRVIMHPGMLIPAPAAGDRFTIDRNLFQRDLSGLPQVQAARAAGDRPTEVRPGRDLTGGDVLSACASVEGPGWRVFVDLLVAEADTAVP